MAITLPPEAHKHVLGSIKRYVAEHFDEDIGDLKAGLMLDFFLKEIAPTVYNQAVADARAYFQARVGDLEGVCFEEEFTYWVEPSEPRKPRRR